VFRLDIFDYNIITSNTQIENKTKNRLSSIVEEQRQEVIYGEVLKIATSKIAFLKTKTIRDNRYIIF